MAVSVGDARGFRERLTWSGTQGPDSIPLLKRAQASEAEVAIAVMFFGDNAFVNPDARILLVKNELQDFVNSMMAYVWHQVKKSTKNQYEKLQRGKVEAMDEYNST